MPYIDVPIDTDPQDVSQDAYTFLQSVIPGWDPNVGNLDVWIIQALATAAAESRDVASRVPTSIFRWFGAYLVGIQPVDATSAAVSVTVTVRDNLGYTIPANTVFGIDIDGTEQAAFQNINNVVINAGSTTATFDIVAVTPGAASSGLGTLGEAAKLITPLDYVTTAILQGTTSGGVDAEEDGVYLNRLQAQLTLLAPRPILPADFAIFARNITGVYRAVAIDGYNPQHNLLNANDASLETSVAGWAAGGNTTISRSTAQAADGAASLALTSVAAGTVSSAQQIASMFPCSPGDVITAVGSSRAATVARASLLQIEFLDAANTSIAGGLATGTPVNNTTTGFTVYTLTATAPANTAKVRMWVVNNATGGAGEVHYWDKLSVRRGTTTDWVPGGTPDTGNERMITVAAIDVLGNPVSTTVRNAIQADLDARREVNFIVNMINPFVSPIDVTYQVQSLPGVDRVALKTAIDAAISAYLDPSTWGATESDPQFWGNVSILRYLELASVINNVAGVDYITTTAGNYDLTMGLHGFVLGRVDITLPGAAPLADAGTLTGVVL